MPIPRGIEANTSRPLPRSMPTQIGWPSELVANTSAPVRVYATGGFDQPNWFDVQRCAPSQSCDHLLVTTQTGQIHDVNFSGGGSDLGALYSSAADGHYSPDNAHILWRQQVRSGYNLMIDSKIFVKAAGAKDWRQ